MSYVSPTDFENVAQRSFLQAAQHSSYTHLAILPFPGPCFSGCFTILGKRQIYSLRGSNLRPMAHKTIALTTELRELPCTPNLFFSRFLEACLLRRLQHSAKTTN